MLGALALAIIGASAGSATAASEEFDKFGVESAFSDLSNRQAGAHPDMMIGFKLSQDGNVPWALARDIEIKLPPGMAGNPEAVRQCTPDQLGDAPQNSHCPFDAQVGTTEIRIAEKAHPGVYTEPIYNMVTPKGMAARLGFIAVGWPAFINVRLDPNDHTIVSTAEGIPSVAAVAESTTRLWGVPASHAHDEERITPQEAITGETPPKREVNIPEVPFLTNPTDCSEERQVRVRARSYQEPDRYSALSAPFPKISGCGLLDFNPATTLEPTTAQGTTGSGLDYGLSLPSDGLEAASVLYGSELRRGEVILPKGMSVNPSEAEGLGVCSEEDLARESFDGPPNAGCPETSKIGSVQATTPVLGEKAEGSLFLAKPYANPFDSLLALYMVLKIPERGVVVKMSGKVTTDPATGQITTVFDDVPQLPVSDFKLHFREGARAPLITPPACGSYDAISNMTPWAAPGKVTPRTNSFAIESGPERGPCPNGGLPPFHPGLSAYPTNLAAGAFSPFNLSLTRKDSEQEITHFSIKLPPGLVAKLAGVPFCPEAGIAQAKARKGIHGGEEEIAAPSCPAASRIGTTWAGSGVGDVLVYVPGKVYLAGPYNGSPLSIVAITAAKAGPFDLGTVVIREALQVNPETGEAFIDATGSDPIPHIIQGIPVHLRDIRAYVDKPDFTLNPTDCSPTSTASTVLGSGRDFASEADDNPLTVTSPFQVADCAALPFKPKLSLRLQGGTKRGDYPKLKAFLRMNGIGEAGVAKARVTLPRSEFIANAHFNTICTRVQFKQLGGNGEACPAGSIYGWARAKTPILSDPLEGPIFLRSSEHQLPDVVASLRGQEINVHLVGHVDSVKGQLRNTFESVPDAPVEWASFSFKGGAKGLFENSTDLCEGAHKAKVEFDGQNGKEANYASALKVKCGGARRPR